MGNAFELHAKWNASGCDSFMYWLFCDQHKGWVELRTKETPMHRQQAILGCLWEKWGFQDYTQCTIYMVDSAIL